MEASVSMREITVYNTMTRQKEVFTPVTPGEAKMYVCGVTPYNHPHIGNARPFVTWDVIRRYMKHVGYKVTYVQNFTDVDDKIINTSNGEGVAWDVIANRYIDSYFEVMDALGVERADVYPRVSTHIPDILKMISTLIDKGFAYELDGDVYFSVEKFDHYGELSGRTLDDMEAGARIEVDGRKKNPMDFALWKAAKPGEPFWESPWGNGRPGWHIECSAMSQKYLGEEFDFHGGGSDLIFPHHENEIAQSEGCSGHHPSVKYWLHNGFITINSEKMSKSLNNFFLVKDILEQYDLLIKSRFVELFGDVVLNTLDWPLVKLSAIAEYRIGLTYKPEAVSSSGIAVLRSGNIQNSQLCYEDTIYVNSKVDPKLLLKKNDILMCARNGSQSLVGKVALIENDISNTTYGAFMMAISSKYYVYLFEYFRSQAFRRLISVGSTTTINQVTTRMLNSIVIPLPDLDTINRFALYHSQINKLKFA